MAPPFTSWTRTEAADEACAAYLAGEKWQDIARRHHVSTMQVWRALYQRGIRPSRLRPPKWCEWCGANYTAHRASQRFCCRACRFDFDRDVSRAEGNTTDCADCGAEFACGGKNYTRCAPCRKRRREAAP